LGSQGAQRNATRDRRAELSGGLVEEEDHAALGLLAGVVVSYERGTPVSALSFRDSSNGGVGFRVSGSGSGAEGAGCRV